MPRLIELVDGEAKTFLERGPPSPPHQPPTAPLDDPPPLPSGPHPDLLDSLPKDADVTDLPEVAPGSDISANLVAPLANTDALSLQLPPSQR